MRLTPAIVALAGLLLAGCSDRQPTRPADQGKLNVVATIFPLASVAQAIGGEHVVVHTLLATGQSPHEFTLKPSQAQVLGDSRLMLMVGLGVDAWAGRAAEAGGAARLRVVRVGEDPALLAMIGAPATLPAVDDHDAHHDAHDAAATQQQATDEHHAADGSEYAADEDEHHEDADEGLAPHPQHDGIDPHVWLDPVLMQQIARQILAELVALDPSHAADYGHNAEAFIAQLRELDRQYRTELSGVASRYVVTYHSAFGYVARRYGLELVSIYDIQGAGLGAGRIEAVSDFIRTRGVKVLFTEPAYPSDKLASLARQMNLRLAVLDDLGSPDRPGYTSYLEMMRSNLRTLADNLKD